MSFGSQAVGFVVKAGTGVYDDLGVEVMTTTTVVVEGCRHRPLRADETPEWITNVATQVWKTTAPPVAAAIAAKSTGQLSVGGQTYQIIGGSQPFTDLGADPFKVTILSQIQTA